MKAAFSHYRLEFVKSRGLACRAGMLVRLDFNDGIRGYADCHPWPELGDQPLNEQLRALYDQQLTPLLQRTIAFARLDAEARALKQNLLADLTMPESHQLIFELADFDQELYQTSTGILKIKMGRDVDKEIAFLKKHAFRPKSFRLDFNERLTENGFKAFLEKIQDKLACVDFFEDPFPFDSQKWTELRTRDCVPLACDRHSLKALSHPNSFDTIVVKPAIEHMDNFSTLMHSRRNIVVTSYLDHPIGQLGAAYVAAKATSQGYNMDVCGLISHQTYADNLFSERLAVHHGRLQPPKDGYGWGYDDLLAKLQWMPLT